MINKYLKQISGEANKINLRNELMWYRKEKTKLMNIPTYYIFNNKELANL